MISKPNEGYCYTNSYLFIYLPIESSIHLSVILFIHHFYSDNKVVCFLYVGVSLHFKHFRHGKTVLFMVRNRTALLSTYGIGVTDFKGHRLKRWRPTGRFFGRGQRTSEADTRLPTAECAPKTQVYSSPLNVPVNFKAPVREVFHMMA